MNIAIIGAGNVGRSLATTFVRAGHTVTIASSDPADAGEVARATGAKSAGSNGEAVAAADIVVLSVPTASELTVATELGTALDGKIVVDVANRPTPDPSGAGTSLAEELQAAIPGATVVKAFNTVLAARQVDPIVAGIPVDGFVAADDPTAKATVLTLVESAGFQPFDAGALIASRTLEGMAWLNINHQIASGGSWQAAWKVIDPGRRVA